MNIDDSNLASEIEFETREELRDLASQILSRTTHTLDITSRHLDPGIYDDDAFIDGVKTLALQNRGARIRIVINDLAPVIARGHRLLDLAQRLPSFFAVKVPGSTHKNFNEAVLIADNQAYIHRQFADLFEGTANLYDRGKARDLTSRFEDLWEKADFDPNLRRLNI